MLVGGSAKTIVSLGLSLCLTAGASAGATLKLRDTQAETLTFASLDGWRDDDHAAAFDAFSKSCSAILQANQAMQKARPVLGALFKVCEYAREAGKLDRAQARVFFETNFSPVRVMPPMHTYGYYTGADGFYTGYYEPEVVGSRIRTDEYPIPLYGVPAKIAGKKSKVFSQYDRVDIEKGALTGKNLEICWVKNPVDAFFAQIQGSTRVKLDDGELLRLNYIASNGKPYTPVGRLLIDRGVFTPQEMSMDKIREYMEANPEEGQALREKNRSFVFFSKTALAPHDECLGAQGIPLTPGRSLAVDPASHVYGTPIWIDAKFPLNSDVSEDTFQHLMVAQDTGSAIRGPARADIYFGHGPDVPHIAGRIKQFGKFVMLVPRSIDVKATIDIPLPRPRPTDIVAEATPATPSVEATAIAKPNP
ncbi:MAG TPA: MltA domain-containing protein [Pseudolabrys sp.]